jgi:hypothetical protein
MKSKKTGAIPTAMLPTHLRLIAEAAAGSPAPKGRVHIEGKAVTVAEMRAPLESIRANAPSELTAEYFTPELQQRAIGAVEALARVQAGCVDLGFSPDFSRALEPRFASRDLGQVNANPKLVPMMQEIVKTSVERATPPARRSPEVAFIHEKNFVVDGQPREKYRA